MTQSQGVAKLKELLFDSEARALNDLQRRIEAVARLGTDQRAALTRDLQRLEDAGENFRVDVEERLRQVFERAGTSERFQKSVAEVIDRSLAEAEIERHEELSSAVAPLVIKTIKREIHESQDELVDALYPITGRLVQAYVASAIREMTERINRQVSSNRTMLRLKSLTTGRSMAELALVEASDFEVEELYLIRRGSGELLARWPDDSLDAHRDKVMSGILTAINEFSLEAFDDDLSTLREIDVNTAQVYLRASPRLLLAARCTGYSNAAAERLIDDEFLTTLEDNATDWDAPAFDDTAQARRNAHLGRTAERIDARLTKAREAAANDRTGWLLLKGLGWLLALLLAAWLAWISYRYVSTEWVRERALGVIAETQSMRGYPVRLTVADYGTAAGLTGLAPTAEAKTEIISRLKEKLPRTEISDNLTVVATGPDVSPELSRLRNDLSTLESQMQRRAFLRSTGRTIDRLGALPADLGQLNANLEASATRATVAETGNTAADVASMLGDLRNRVRNTATLDDTTAGRMREALNAQRRRLDAATRSLAGLLGSAAAAPSSAGNVPGLQPAEDLTAEAEALAVQAERLATLVVALAQASSIKPPPVVAPQEPTPRERVAAFIRDHAVFFSTGTRFRSPTRTASHLDELAQLLRQTDVTLRIIGFTDEKGGSSQNSPLSQDRADVVKRALVSRGVDADRLIAVGRLDAKDISGIVGDNSPNRRVEFEMGFVGETAG